MIDRELFVFTSSRKKNYDNFDRYFNLNLVGLALTSFITYLFIYSLTYYFNYFDGYGSGMDTCFGRPNRSSRWCEYDYNRYKNTQDIVVDIGYALNFAPRIIYSIIMTILELAFFYCLPYTLRFVLKPRESGKSIIDDEQNSQINKNLKLDISLAIQIRIMFLALILLYGFIYYLSGFENLPLLTDFFTIPQTTLSFANILTGISIVIFLLRRYRTKVNFEDEYKKNNNKFKMYETSKSNTEIVLYGIVYTGISYLITWTLIFGALYTILVTPWDIFEW